MGRAGEGRRGWGTAVGRGARTERTAAHVLRRAAGAAVKRGAGCERSGETAVVWGRALGAMRWQLPRERVAAQDREGNCRRCLVGRQLATATSVRSPPITRFKNDGAISRCYPSCGAEGAANTVIRSKNGKTRERSRLSMHVWQVVSHAVTWTLLWTRGTPTSVVERWLGTRAGDPCPAAHVCGVALAPLSGGAWAHSPEAPHRWRRSVVVPALGRRGVTPQTKRSRSAREDRDEKECAPSPPTREGWRGLVCGGSCVQAGS